jgi:hypothetical protein
MKCLRNGILILGALVLFVSFGCQSSSIMHTQTVPDAAYQAALARTETDLTQLPISGSAEEAAMLQPMMALFEQYTETNLRENIQKVYAENVYFRDAFKQLNTAAEIEDYMVAGMAPIEGAEFVFNNVLRTGVDFYFDWTMRLDFKKTPKGTWEESIGMSRMRFNAEGQVIFHQDYWDPTDIVYKRIPIVRQLIAYVKRKL